MTPNNARTGKRRLGLAVLAAGLPWVLLTIIVDLLQRDPTVSNPLSWLTAWAVGCVAAVLCELLGRALGGRNMGALVLATIGILLSLALGHSMTDKLGGSLLAGGGILLYPLVARYIQRPETSL